MAGSDRLVIIDDTDPSIHYSGQGWFLDRGSTDDAGNFGPTWNRTSHGTRASDSVSFSFEGTHVLVFGAMQITKLNSDGTLFDPTWECFIDDNNVGAQKPFFAVENGWQLCEAPDLADGPHEITIRVKTAGGVFWLDSLRYRPSPGASVPGSIYIDNNDPAIQYDGSWGKVSSVMRTTRKGAIVKVDFVGTRVQWFGWYLGESPHAAALGTYTVDGGSPVSFVLKGLSDSTNQTHYGQQLFATSPLPQGPHSIIVTYNGGDAVTPLTLRFLVVTDTSGTFVTQSNPIPNPLAAPDSSAPSPAPSSESTPLLSSVPSSFLPPVSSPLILSNTLPITSTVSSPISSSAPSPETFHPHRTSTLIGAIIGGVIGGLTLLAAIIFFYRRRRIRRQAVLEDQTAVPFMHSQDLHSQDLPPPYNASSSALESNRSGTKPLIPISLVTRGTGGNTLLS
ncbi:hypothetical protein D9615_007052 [Tricholomella constricta]|uniref:Transmembrane protein n=1 Tax=Tricholomella constricta TaxID=117010 RepID=A0A8H5H884_9AGAR|nr:hypothetical protein D9615_007052 [Tricholomella constricta]